MGNGPRLAWPPLPQLVSAAINSIQLLAGLSESVCLPAASQCSTVL